jgi:tetratricopeptide (TPR) repeat protein
LTARLHNLKDLRVVSPLFASEPRELGKRLAVETVLIGTLHYSGGRLRAAVQLVSARNGSVLWAEDGQEIENGNLYTAQQVLASAIAARLRGRVLSAERAKLQRRGSTSTQAWEAFLRGRAEAVHIGMESGEGSASRARPYFETAVQLDPGFADAWAWLALVQQAEFFAGESQRSQLEAAIANTRRALAIDPDNIAARRTLIHIYHSTGQSEEALRQAKRAREVDATDPEAMLAAARAYFRTSMLDRAMSLYERYLTVYPDDEGARNDLLTACVFADAYERGIRAAQPGLAVQRLFYPTHLLYANSGDFSRAVPMARQSMFSPSAGLNNGYFAGVVLKAAGLDDEAQRLWREVIERMNRNLDQVDNERTRMFLAMTYAQTRQANKAREQIERALALNPGDPWILFFASEAEALLADRAAALDYLRRSVANGFLGLHYLDYYQKPLYGWHRYRKDPDFRAIREGLARKIAELRTRY